MNKIGSSHFSVSDCSELMNPVCLKDITTLCGPNTLMDARGFCFCNTRFYEAELGDASTSKGCLDPCQNQPCSNQPNTFCFALNAKAFRCIDENDFLPKKDNSVDHDERKGTYLHTA